jgi:carbamoyl-phosphate synthase large subunit
VPKLEWVKKVVVLGSGAIKIGEAAEFDYSGSQALKALREEHIETVLINPNIATIQTDPKLGGKVYLLPVTPNYVEQVIRREKPDAILLGFGGQTALNCGVKLAKSGVLERYDVKVLGTPIRAIEDTEDRELFRQAMIRGHIPVPKSASATSVRDAAKIAEEIGYPVIVRVAYTLGGKGSGVAKNQRELNEIVERALAHSMIEQVLVEEYLEHWKEIEYEVMRDSANNCLTVCNMENFDPMGVHTGDSIVVAPSQTLNNREYQLLRSLSIKAIQSLGIVGECNIQWALKPTSEDVRAIEVNARMSRSSALASKATGYPLAYIAAKLAMGYSLPELLNKVTGVTTSCFEPALDYVIVKIPRWDFQKFRSIDRDLGPQMKSVGEVMAVGRCFEEALQKAVRMIEVNELGLTGERLGEKNPRTLNELKQSLANPTDERIFDLIEALRKGVSIDELYKLTGIDRWYLYCIKNILSLERQLAMTSLGDNDAPQLIQEAKKLGFSDRQIAHSTGTDELTVRKFRKEHGITPVVKQIDTLAAEWPAKTNYLYLTYGGSENDGEIQSGKKAIVLGSGVFRIGSSVEFDWGAVNTVWALKKHGMDEAIMINCNPETVSTDYDTSDKLYFEELSLERILDIYEIEKPLGAVVGVGGQTPNNLAMKLAKAGVTLIGASAESIDRAEDRSKFSALLDQLNIPQPRWSTFTRMEDVKFFARKIGYPVLVRPSYVLSGSAMRVAHDEEELEGYLRLAARFSAEHPVVISEFMEGAREVEVDGVSDGEDVLIGAVIEHVENAGVHSGDATMSIPTQTLPQKTVETIREYTSSIMHALSARSSFNIQYLVKNGTVYVIECNLRASRSFPYTSKTVDVNLIDVATSVMMGKTLKDMKIDVPRQLPYVSVKAPQFSFMRLGGADPILGVEMVSTGEVACIGDDLSDALLKALEASEFTVPPKQGSILITVGTQAKERVVQVAKRFEDSGFKIFATEHTADALRNGGLHDVTVLNKIRDQKEPNVLTYLLKREIDLVINIPAIKEMSAGSRSSRKDEYLIRRLAVEFNIPIVTTIELSEAVADALANGSKRTAEPRSLNEYEDSLQQTIQLQQAVDS